MNTPNSKSENELRRVIDWKQGLAIALGVPLLILPSLSYFPMWVSASAIIIWALSVIQGFFQNTAYGELATTFSEYSGLPGFAQAVFSSPRRRKYDIGSFVGGFSAWCYWLAWSPVLAIYAILVGGYLYNLFPHIASMMTQEDLSLLMGALIFTLLFIVNFYFGLEGSAVAGYIMAILSFVPLIIITLGAFFSSSFDIKNITSHWLPSSWKWDISHFLILFGLFAMAEWSAGAWETAAIYGPEYKNPARDIPLALFIAGLICLFTFVAIQTAVLGVLGVQGTVNQPISPLIPVAKMAFGKIGAIVAILALIISMLLIIQTAFLGSARALHSMAREGNLPSYFSRVNKRGVPYMAMVVTALFNMFLITLKTPVAILAASAIGYSFANSISLWAYVKASIDPRIKRRPRPFRAPRGWLYPALFFALFNVPLCLTGLVYLNNLEIGWIPTFIGFGILLLYIPIWFYSRSRRGKD